MEEKEKMRGLIHGHLDGTSSESEVRELSEALAQRPDLADAFVDACRTDAFLEATFGGRADADGLTPRRGVPRSAAARRARLLDGVVWIAGSVAAALLLGFLLLAPTRTPPSSPQVPLGLESRGDPPAAAEIAAAPRQDPSPGFSGSASAREGGADTQPPPASGGPQDPREAATTWRGAPNLTGLFLGRDGATGTISVRVLRDSGQDPGEAGDRVLPPERKLRLAGETEIVVDGKPGKLEALRSGCNLRLWLSRGSNDSLSALEAIGPRLSSHRWTWIETDPRPMLHLSGVTGVDSEKRTITLRLGRPPRAVETRPVAPDARIVVDGLPATLADVAPERWTYLEISADMKTVVAIRQSTAGKGPSGSTATPYPYPLPQWYEDLERKMGSILDLPGGKRTLEEFARAVAAAGAVTVELRDGATSLAQSEIDLPAIAGMRCKDALEFAATQVTPPLKVCRCPSAVVLTDRPEIYPPPSVEPARRRMEEVRALHSVQAKASKSEAVERAARARKALEGTKVALTFDGTPLDDVIRAFGMFIDTQVMVDKSVDAAKVVHLDVKKMPAEEALDMVLSRLGLSHFVGEDGIVMVTTAENAIVEKRRQAWEAERAARWDEKARELRAAAVEHDLAGKLPREAVEALGAATGLPVYPDPWVWYLQTRLDASSTLRTVGGVAAAMEKLGVLFVVEPDGVFLLR